jgi:CubicO group peptidase (beta-lactamase class C family)
MKVSELWPEFSAHDKQDITVEDVCKHEAGLFKINDIFTLDELQRECIKKGSIASAFTDAVPKDFPKHRPKLVSNSKHLPVWALEKYSLEDKVHQHNGKHLTHGRSRAYHSITRGWILNEIVMRVDPSHRTVGEFIRDEVAKPLNIADSLTIGDETAALLQKRKIKSLTHVPVSWLWVNLFKWWNRHDVSHKSIILHLLVYYVSICR